MSLPICDMDLYLAAISATDAMRQIPYRNNLLMNGDSRRLFLPAGQIAKIP
jgi:hypothetical protein